MTKKITFAKRVLFLILAIATFVVGVSLLIKALDERQVANSPQPSQVKEQTIPSFSFVASKNQTVAEAMLEMEKKGEITLKYKDYGGELGIFIEEINGIPTRAQKDKGAWWQFWVNGKHSNKGASSVKLKAGDEVIWRFVGAQEGI